MRLAWLLALAIALPAAAATGKPLVVTTDEAYPPYYFRDAQGRAQGIVVDKWALFTQRTGIPVEVVGREWSRAQASMLDGSADIIDPITRTPAREPLYLFSQAYASADAAVFFHRSIPGISDLASFRGFALGAKTGSACARWLSERGTEPRWLYPDAEALVRAAGAGEFVLFCSDVPSANYYLHKHGIASEFRQAPPLYNATYHWAVPKGRESVQMLLVDGFNRISVEELRAIDERWFGISVGKPVVDSRVLWWLAAAVAAALALAAAMFAWNRSLRSRVADRTAELSKALASVHESSARIEDLYNHAPCGYHSLDAEGCYLEVNDTELGWLGRSRDEVIGRPFADFLSEESRRAHQGHLAEVFTSGVVRDSEYELAQRDGSQRSVLISAVAVRDSQGRFVRTRSTVYDISDRKRAEAEVRRMNTELETRVRERTRELENANRELESFSYTVSHDLRAPLRHIVAYLSMLEEELHDGLSAQSHRHLDTARGAARRLDDLIYSLLDFARLGRAAVNHETVRVSGLVGETRAAITAELPKRAIDWTIEELPEVQADPALLRQVFTNILSNAVKYTRTRERAQIRVGTAPEHATPAEFAFFVKDNGVGFDMKHAGKLFGVFQRLHSDRDYEGNGIGLAIVMQIVQRHGGRVWAASELGVGTTIFFTLPREPVRHVARRGRVSSRPA